MPPRRVLQKEFRVSTLDRYRTGCLIAVLALASSFGWHREPPRSGADRDDDGDRDGEPDDDHAGPVADADYQYLQRRLPDGRINVQARARALAHARLLRARLIATSGLDAAGVWQLRGPINIGGRVTDLVADPANASKFYVGSASGGVWKTTDGGATFTPIFDGLGTLSIGALALDPRDSNILYVGTGEANPGGGSTTQPGDGVWKTTDGGATWQHLGLDNTFEIGRIVVDPRNPSNVFVAAMGALFFHNVDRGVYRSQDGGLTWTKVLFVSDGAG